MKTLKMIGYGVVFCLLTTMVVAAAQEDRERRGPAGGRGDGVGRGGAQRAERMGRPEAAGRAGMNREEMYKQMMASRMKTHQKGIDELEAIKKIAEEEEATRTVQALQTMIDKKDKAFKDSIAKFEKTRRERAEQMQSRRGQMETKKIEDDDEDKKEQPTVTQ